MFDLLLLLPSPSLALRLLAHKIQSPQEMEALHALTVSAFICLQRGSSDLHTELAGRAMAVSPFSLSCLSLLTSRGTRNTEPGV